jgi:uncharacterized protein YdhG (YjbR/CyaY superfamily)
VTSADVDGYLAGLTEPKRSSLEQLRRRIREVIPEAEECMSYGVPAFKIEGKVVAGFAAFKKHLSYLPHSGSVLPTLADKLADYQTTKGSLHFPIDQPLAQELVNLLVRTRMRELGLG